MMHKPWHHVSPEIKAILKGTPINTETLPTILHMLPTMCQVAYPTLQWHSAKTTQATIVHNAALLLGTLAESAQVEDMLDAMLIHNVIWTDLQDVHYCKALVQTCVEFVEKQKQITKEYNLCIGYPKM